MQREVIVSNDMFSTHDSEPGNFLASRLEPPSPPSPLLSQISSHSSSHDRHKKGSQNNDVLIFLCMFPIFKAPQHAVHKLALRIAHPANVN